MTTSRLILLSALLLVCQMSRLCAQDPALALEETVVKLVERIEPSVVSIARVKPAPYDPALDRVNPFERMRLLQELPPTNPEHPDFQPNEFGTGLVIAGANGDERLILTNYHVVRGGPVAPATSANDGTVLILRFADRRRCDASIIAADPRSDLAVLRPHFKPGELRAAELKPLDWSAAAPVKKGQFVVLFGNPHALARDGSASVGWGMVGNLTRRPLPWTKDFAAKVMLYRLGNLMQIDGRLNLGASGGPVVNLKGELVGLSTSLAAVDGYEKSAGFAIPFDELTRRVVKSLVAGHEVEYGMLGIQPVDVLPTDFQRLGISAPQAAAAEAKLVQRDAPAERAGIEAGDVLLRVNDQPVLSDYDLMRLVGQYPPEAEVDILVWRQQRRGEPFTVRVKLGKWPVQDDLAEAIVATTPRFAPWRGLTVDYPTARAKYSSDRLEGSGPYRRAVVVLNVADDSPARAAELQPGDFISHVNRTPVQTPAEFHNAVKAATGPVTLRLYQGPSPGARSVVVRE